MIALDTNLLVYAHRRDSPWHQQAAAVLSEVARGPKRWALPWPTIFEFLAIVTHPKIFSPPSSLPTALEQVEAWRSSPFLCLLSETPEMLPLLGESLIASGVTGPRVHDARIAVLCRHHGVEELWTADRDFGRFPWLKVRNPLVA
jgi:uncharacterized protein